MTASPRFLCRLVPLALLWVGLAAAAAPRAEVLRHVPSDIGMCVLLESLRDRGDALAASPFVAKLAASPMVKNAPALAEVRKLLAVEKQVEAFTGLSAQRLRDEILGDLVVLAYKPGPTGKPDEEQGLILVHVRDPKALASLIRHVNDLEKKSGKLAGIEERTHRGVTYFCRKEKDAPTFYALRGSLLLFSGQEAMLRRAIESAADLKADAVAPLEQAVQKLGVAGSLLTLWVNPRAYDAELTQKLGKATGPEAALLTTLLTYWKALDGVAMALQLDADLTLSVAVTGQPEKVSPAARAFLTTLAEPNKLWRALPEEPLFGVAARIDFAALLDVLGEFLTKENKQTLTADLQRLGAPLGRNLIREILPALGPDLGLIVLPPTPEQKGIVPRVQVSLRVRQTEEPVERALVRGLDTLATLILLGHNGKNPDKILSLKQDGTGKVEISYLNGEGVFPVGLRPAFGFVRGHLTLATSPEVLRTLAVLLSEDATSEPTTPVPLLRISFGAWRSFLTQRQPDIVKALVAEGSQADDAKSLVLAWVAGLEYLDRLEVRHQPDAGRILLQLSLKPRWPLK